MPSVANTNDLVDVYWQIKRKLDHSILGRHVTYLHEKEETRAPRSAPFGLPIPDTRASQWTVRDSNPVAP